MKELIIEHIPAAEKAPARIRVIYRKDSSTQPQIAETDFDFQISDEDRRLIQWYLEEYLQYPWGEFVNRANKAKELMRSMGEKLFNSIFKNPLTSKIYNRYIANDLDHTNIIIHASNPSGISIPWELISDPTFKEYGNLTMLANSFTRSQPDLNFEAPDLPQGESFNILMAICRPHGPADVPFQSVARPLVEMFRPFNKYIHLDVLRPPTFEQLGKALRSKPNYYHVFHFDGHGTFPNQGNGRFFSQTGSQGQLAFENEEGKARLVSGQELGSLLASTGIPIVLMNACQSGMTNPQSLYPSIGNQLLKAKVGGVIAMAYSVYVYSAVNFMQNLYEGLINGSDLGRAVCVARENLRLSPQRPSPIGDIELHDWIVPILFQSRTYIPHPKQEEQPLVNLEISNDDIKQPQEGQEVNCPEKPAYGFIGRDDITLELERAFRQETVVLLKGMAGVGKTEMAIGFGRWWAETNALQGPIFFSKFEQYNPLAQVIDRIGNIFNPTIRKSLNTDYHLLDEKKRYQSVLSILKQIPCLIIWDNFEPVNGFPSDSNSNWTKEEQQELRKFLHDLQGGKTRVLITSRREEEWLGDIYRTIQVKGLRQYEAQQLAVKVLQRKGMDPAQIKDLPQYNDLLKYLQGNPLVIQSILPLLKTQHPENLLQALKDGSAKISKDDSDLGREQSLVASLNYQLEQFDTLTRKRLGILGLFQGFVNLDILSTISQKIDNPPDFIRGLSSEDWIEILNLASEAGLLRVWDNKLFSIHPALPWFFHELMQDVFHGYMDWFENAFITAIGRYAYFLYKQFDRKSSIANILLSFEEQNLHYAMRLAINKNDWDNIQNILYGFERLLTVQDRWTEWDRIISQLEIYILDKDCIPIQGCESLHRSILGCRSTIYHFNRKFEKETDCLLLLKQHYKKNNDKRNLSECLRRLGSIAQEKREWEEAERCYHQSLDIEEHFGNKQGQARTLHQLGIIAQLRHQWEKAERYYRQSLDINEQIGNEKDQVSTLHQLGTIAQGRRQWGEAESWYRKGLEIEKRIGNKRGQAIILKSLGIIAQERHQWDEAERCYRKSLIIDEFIGDEHGQIITLHLLGMIAQARRQWEEAESWYYQSLDISRRIGDEQDQANTLHNLGMIAQKRHQWEKAEQWYRKSLEIKKHIRDEHAQASTLHLLGTIAEEQHRWNEAERWYSQSLAIDEKFGNERGQVSTLYKLAIIAEKLDNLDKAIQYYQQAEQISIKTGDNYSLSIVRKSIDRISKSN
jgi:tetratricopeptide (TPR) repeat protein